MSSYSDRPLASPSLRAKFITRMRYENRLPSSCSSPCLSENSRNVSPLSSSCGRLFDAVSFLCGTAPQEMEFEAEAAMRLEAAATEKTAKSYPFDILENQGPALISFAPAVRGLVEDRKRGLTTSLLASKFHNTLIRVISEMAGKARREHGIETVSLAGGCFLNRRLLNGTENLLRKKGFTVVRSEAYSPNDESLSLGQIAYALAALTVAKGAPGEPGGSSKAQPRHVSRKSQIS